MESIKITVVDMGLPGRRMKAKHGNFSIGFIRCFQEIEEDIELLTVPVSRAEEKHFEEADGIVLSGALEGAYEDLPWKESFNPLALKLIDSDTPMLGICFGHHYISMVKGGEVINDLANKEHGRYEITLTEEGKKDPLFKDIPEKEFFYATHNDRISLLAPGAVHLASSERVEYHAYRVGNNTWGMQFHPEFYLEMMKDCLLSEYKEGPEFEKEFEKASLGHGGQKIIDNFIEIIKNRR